MPIKQLTDENNQNFSPAIDYTEVGNAPPANYTTPIPLGEGIKVWGAPSGSDLVGKLQQGATISSAVYPALTSMLVADRNAGTVVTQVIAGILYNSLVRGASGRYYYPLAEYNQIISDTGSVSGYGYIDDNTFLLPFTDFTKVRELIAYWPNPGAIGGTEIYSDGYVVITSQINMPSVSSFTWNFPNSIEFANTNFVCTLGSTQFNATTTGGRAFNIVESLPSRTTTSVQFSVVSNANTACQIRVEGFIVPWRIQNLPRPTMYYQVGNTVVDPQQITSAGALNDITNLQLFTNGLADYIVAQSSGLSGATGVGSVNYINGWWRKWKSGRIEQGATFTSAIPSNAQVFNFIIPFISAVTNFNVSFFDNSSGTAEKRVVGLQSTPTLTTFQLYGSNTHTGLFWSAEGY